jgi:UDP-glucose 4-epimerase
MSAEKHVLVTGGAGYVGSHCVLEMLEDGAYKPVVVDNLDNASKESVRRVENLTGNKVDCHWFDLLDKDRLRSLFKEYQFLGVIHFAGLKAVGESVEKPLHYYQVNLGIAMNLLEVMTEFGVKNLVFSSSATVYGQPQTLPMSETHPVGNCSNPYGSSKFFVEQILRDMCKSDSTWNVILLRYFNPVGAHSSGDIGEDPHGTPNNLMPYILQVAIGKRPYLSIFGSDYDTPDGTGVRDYIHVVDLANGHIAALRLLEESCGLRTYNLGSGKGYSVLELLRAMEKVVGKEIPYQFTERRNGDVASCYSNAELAWKELKWRAEKGVKQFCEDAWRWQTQNPDGYQEN